MMPFSPIYDQAKSNTAYCVDRGYSLPVTNSGVEIADYLTEQLKAKGEDMLRRVDKASSELNTDGAENLADEIQGVMGNALPDIKTLKLKSGERSE